MTAPAKYGEESFRVETRKEPRTQPVFHAYRKWLRDRPTYKRIVLAEYERPERWEGDVEVIGTGSKIATLEYVDGQHVLREVGRG